MKKVSVFFLMLIMLGCCNKQRCTDCYTGGLPVLNGTSPGNGINTANVFVDTAYVEETDTELILHAKIGCTRQGGNNDAHNLQVIVLLPAEVDIKSFSGADSCLIWNQPETMPNSGVKSATLSFFKKHLAIDNSFDIKVVTSRPHDSRLANTYNFGVLAFAQSPDVVLCDNYWYFRKGNFCDNLPEPQVGIKQP